MDTAVPVTALSRRREPLRSEDYVRPERKDRAQGLEELLTHQPVALAA